MNNFLKTYRLALTPLSPIHIGCGEDFEPTNYVIDDGVLYGFDPSRAVLNESERKKLIAAANSGDWLDVSRFFRDNAALFKLHATVMIPVSGGVAKQYKDRLGNVANREVGGSKVINKLELERTQYSGISLQPYIPGSSFKGAIRTAMLDALNREQRVMRNERSEEVERRLLKGDFGTSPLRLLKIADLMPAYEPTRRILFAVNRKKTRIIKDGQELQPKGIAARKECILQGQYRLFVADAVLPSLDPHQDGKTTPAPELRPTDLKHIAKQSNAYNLTRLRRELRVLDGRGFVNPTWKTSIEGLLAGDLGKKLDGGDAFLIRLGRYGGAESKTLSGEGVANIKIMGAKGQPATFESTTKTVWLAAEYEQDQKHLLPFGWAVVEINPQAEAPQLKAWCDAESKGRRDMVALRQSFEAEKAKALEDKAAKVVEIAARAAANRAEILAQAQRALALASLSVQAQQIEVLRQQCEAQEVKIVNGNFKKHPYSAGNPGAFYLDAAKLVKEATETTGWSAADKTTLAGMLEIWLPKVIIPWDAKDQRKKLKIAALNGL